MFVKVFGVEVGVSVVFVKDVIEVGVRVVVGEVKVRVGVGVKDLGVCVGNRLFSWG